MEVMIIGIILGTVMLFGSHEKSQKEARQQQQQQEVKNDVRK
jgi:hypothetical protein